MGYPDADGRNHIARRGCTAPDILVGWLLPVGSGTLLVFLGAGVPPLLRVQDSTFLSRILRGELTGLEGTRKQER